MGKIQVAAVKAHDEILKRRGEITFIDAFASGYEQSKQDTIERACDTLFSMLPIIVSYYNEDIHEHADRSEFIKAFRKAMEEEKLASKK